MYLLGNLIALPIYFLYLYFLRPDCKYFGLCIKSQVLLLFVYFKFVVTAPPCACHSSLHRALSDILLSSINSVETKDYNFIGIQYNIQW